MARALAALLLAAVLVASAGAATPQRGGTLVHAVPGVNCLNPFGCNALFVQPQFSLVLRGAFTRGPDLVYRPTLVSRVTVRRSPFTLTYHLRPEARWSDGVPVTAADFVFTFRAFATHELTALGARDPLYAKIRRVRALNARTVRVVGRERIADWRDLFAVVLPRHALQGEDLKAVWRDRIDNPKTGRPIGSGPFLLSRHSTAALESVFVRNPGYWRPRPHLDRIVLRATRDPADPLGPLRRNEVHFAVTVPGTPLSLSVEQAAEVRRLRGWRVVTAPAPAKEHLAFNLGPDGHRALRNRLVRRALAYGIDRVEIARRVNVDLGGSPRPLDSTVFYPAEVGYRPNWSVYRYDAARARRLLADAGCRPGADGVHSCGGERLTLRFVTTAGNAARELTLELVRAQLRRVGVEVQPVYAPSPALFNAIRRGGDFDVLLFAWIVDPGGRPMPETRCGDVQNWGGYCSRLVDRDLKQRDLLVDEAARAAALNSADVKLARDVPVLPLLQPLDRFAVSDVFRGFRAGGAFLAFYQSAEEWWRAR